MALGSSGGDSADVVEAYELEMGKFAVSRFLAPLELGMLLDNTTSANNQELHALLQEYSRHVGTAFQVGGLCRKGVEKKASQAF
jgi:hypothetical protein